MRVSFGKRYEEGHESKKILKLLDDLQATITNFFISDNWPGLPFADIIDRLTGKMGRLEKCFQNLDMFYQELIEEHLEPQNLKSHEEDQDMIDVLIQLKNKPILNTTSELTYNHIKAILMVINMFFPFFFEVRVYIQTHFIYSWLVIDHCLFITILFCFPFRIYW